MPEPDKDIFLRAQNGDTDAFQRIVVHYQRYAYALAFRFLGHPEDAEDAVQEAFVRVWKNLSSFKLEGKFTTWLYRIVVNLCYDRIKMKKRYRKVHMLWQDNIVKDCFSKEIRPDEALTQKETSQMIRNLSWELKPKQRMVFVLRDLQDLSMEEVSGILNMSVNSVKSNLYHARRNIRKKLEAIK